MVEDTFKLKEEYLECSKALYIDQGYKRHPME